MLKKKEKPPKKVQTAQEFVNVEDVQGGLLYAKNGYLFGYLQVQADNSELLSDSERKAYVSTLTGALESEKEPWQLLSIPRTVDTTGMLEHLGQLRRATNDDAKIRLLTGEMEALRDMAEEGVKEPVIVLKIWCKAARGADKELHKRLQNLSAHLGSARIRATRLDDHQITYICRLFADLSEYQDKEEVWQDDEIPVLPDEARGFTKNTPDGARQALQNVITPVGGLQFGVSRTVVGSVTGRIYGAVRFPAGTDYNWLAEAVNASDAITSITYFPGNASELAGAISRSIKRSVTDAAGESDPRRRIQLDKQVKDGAQLIEAMDYQHEAIGHAVILVMPFTSKEELLDDVCRGAVGRFARKKVKLKALGNLQQTAYRHLSPYYPDQPEVNDMLRHIMPLKTLMGGAPMTVNLFRDARGYYFARTPDGGVISIDLMYRGGTRTNGNIVCTGMPGSGKSTALKHIILSEYMAGMRILLIDPERELRDLCKALGAAWLDVGGGGNCIVNPLQIRPAPPDAEEETDRLYQSRDNALALHLSTLEVFFKLYLPGMTDVQRSLLKIALTELYEKWGITFESDVHGLSGTDFPTMQDLHALLEEKAKTDPRCTDLAVLLYAAAKGDHARLWNGHTNVDTDAQVICFDTNTLMGSSSEEVLQAQYFNIMTHAWEMMSADRAEPVFLMCDEAHLMLNPKTPEPAMFLRNISKRDRKYEGVLAVVMQSLSDALHEQIKMYGQALIDNAAYKILFRTEGANLKQTAALFDLTEAEQEVLLGAVRGRALFMAGAQRMVVQFDIPQYKLELMGKGGGR